MGGGVGGWCQGLSRQRHVFFVRVVPHSVRSGVPHIEPCIEQSVKRAGLKAGAGAGGTGIGIVFRPRAMRPEVLILRGELEREGMWGW